MSYWVILLLGSYDPKTKALLYDLRECLLKNFMDHPDQFLILLLDNLEVFTASGVNENGSMENMILLAERYDANRVSMYRIHEDFIADEEDIILGSATDVVGGINEYLGKNYTETSFHKVTILEELKFISGRASLTFLIREFELTRGGEYIELVYLLANNLNPSQIIVMKKELLDLSEMAWEVLDSYNVNMRTYKDNNSLCSEVTRIMNNHILRLS